MTLLLTGINFSSVFISLYLILKLRTKIPKDSIHFSRLSLPYIIGCIAGSGTAGLLSAYLIPMMPDSFLYPEQFGYNVVAWWSAEIFNYVILLPIFLASPRVHTFIYWWNNFSLSKVKSLDWLNFLPFMSIVITCLITQIYFAPGALLYPLAAMMWAATIYRVFTITLINAIVCLMLYHSISYIYLGSPRLTVLDDLISVRIGLSILAITTLYICVMNLKRKQLYDEMTHLANHDSLTEAMSRRNFLVKADIMIREKRCYPISILMLDLDHFKKLNDEYGHHVGDIALQHFAKLVKSNLRSRDLFCRIGGEEFVILLYQTPYDAAVQVAERIRTELMNTPFSTEQYENIGLSVSIGMTYRDTLMPSFKLQSLMHEADQAMYMAKHNGRNQVQVHIIEQETARSMV